MNKGIVLSLILSATMINGAFGQSYPYGDHWYENPLGFDPVELHARNGFIIPAAAVALCLLLTDKDPSLTDRLSLTNESGVSRGYRYPYTTLYQNNSGMEYRLRKWLAAGAELLLYFPRDEFNKTWGIGVRPFARFYPFHKSSWRVFFESGGGLIYFFRNFPRPTGRDPRLGTRWNGTTKYGIGGEIALGGGISLLFGVRHIHVSNGNVKGVERNPSHDSNGLWIGFSHRPMRNHGIQ
jgi:hypothetical protein